MFATNCIRFHKAYVNLSLHQISKRHVQSLMNLPVRRGYWIGSFIPPEIVKEMELESILQTKYSSLEDSLSFVDVVKDHLNQDDAFNLNKNKKHETSYSETNIQSSVDIVDQFYRTLTENKIKVLTELFEIKTENVLASTSKNNNMFNPNAKCAVNWELSTIGYVERSSDSIHTHALLYEKTESETVGDYANKIVEETRQKMSGSGIDPGMQFRKSIFDEVVTSSKQSGSIDSTLVLSAFATHSKVRQFLKLELHPLRILRAWNHFYHELKIKFNELDEVVPATDDVISIVTECQLGSAFVGVVNFIKDKHRASQRQANVEILKYDVQTATELAAICGNTSISRELAKKAADSIDQESSISMKFDIFCLGYCPQFDSKDIANAVANFSHFDPGRLYNTSTSTDDFHKKEQSNNVESDALQRSLDESRKQANMASVINATVNSLQEIQNAKAARMLDSQAFMRAFCDYVKTAPNVDSGYAIGMNLTSYNRTDVVNMIKNYNNYNT